MPSPAEGMLFAECLSCLLVAVCRLQDRLFNRTRASFEALSFVLYSCSVTALVLIPNPEPRPRVSRWPSSVKAKHFERDKDYGVL